MSREELPCIPARRSRVKERRSARPERIDPHQAYSINETCAALDSSRASFYKLVAAGKIKTITGLDKRPRVAGSEIIRLTSG